MQILALALALAVAACAPAVDGPAERRRALDREDGAQLTAQLAALPGVVRAEAVVRRPVRDPLAPARPEVGAASIVVVVDDRADRAAITEAARTLARALVPEAAPAIVVEVGARRPSLAKVGPFTVEAASRAPLRATLAAALALLAALAAWIVWTARLGQRRGKSAQ